MGNAIVLQDDALLHMLEEPVDGANGTDAAALVDIGIKAFDLTGPIDLLLDYPSRCIDLFGFVRAIGFGAVAGHKKGVGLFGRRASIT